MKRNILLWIIAVVLTLASAIWQRLSGPTYPIRGSIQLGGRTFPIRLDRSHGGPGDQPVQLKIPDSEVRGQVRWREHPSEGAWKTIELQRNGELLEALLPHQPPAGKLEYGLLLTRQGEQAVFPEKPALTRFKGDVSAIVLVPHIFLMFFGMLLSTRAGLEAFGDRKNIRPMAQYAFLLLFAGGIVLGPVVQKAAFGAWWTGVPFGWDLTDNKTLIAVVAWALALWRQRGFHDGRWSVFAAALITMVTFAIPHSLWGSELQR